VPGFSGGPFGGDPFGEFNWSRRVLFETAPEIYRTADAEQNDLFRKYAEAQGVSFDNLRRKIAAFADLRDPQAARTQYDEVTTLRLGKIEQIKGPVEQSGVLASVSAISVFTTRRGRFTQADVGKEITVSNSLIATNNGPIVITNIVSATEVLTNPPLATDPGSLRWELRELEASTTKETLVKVRGGDVEEITPGWILSDGYADFTVLKRQQFKPEEDERKLLTLREGTDGSINGALNFTSPTLALTSRDVGRRLTIAGSLNPETNDDKFEIVDVLSATECLLDGSPDLIAEPTGALVWALLRSPELTLAGSAILRGVIEREGDDGEITVAGSPTTFEADSARFTADDVGKLLTLHRPGSVDNNTYEILTRVSDTVVTLDGPTAGLGSNFHWEMRAATSKGDETQVEVRATSLLQYLAQDFGIEIDARESEEWQRRWTESVSRWIGLKGHGDGYMYVAELTGFTAVVTGLYRVNQETYLAVLAAGGEAHMVGDEGADRSGSDGSLDVVGGLVRFSSPTAAFVNGDAGRQIYVTGTFGSTNDGFRTIVTVVDAQTVEFRLIDTMTGVSDPNNGALVWSIVRLYAEQAPTLPVYDEINSDRMTYLKGVNVFTVDKYCWEQSPAPWSTTLGPGDAGDGRIFITSVDPGTAFAFATTYTLEGRGDFSVITGLGIGRWRLTDLDPTAYFVETAPTLHERHSGSDGSLEDVAGDRVFSSPSATFTGDDVGRFVVVQNAAQPENNKAWLVLALINATSLKLSTAHAVVVDDPNNGNLDWKVLAPDATGTDGNLTAPRRFTSASATFTAADEGKRLIVSESGSGNNKEYIVDTFIDANNVDLESTQSPVVPDANNGSLVWGLFSWELTVVATEPPAVGAATLDYICPELLMCHYCRAAKVLIEASTPYLMEKGFERLRDRIAQVTPKHVEVIESYGVEANASLALTATVDSP
jgi:hypothetical protein